MANQRCYPKGLIFTAFGAGFLLSLCFPDKFILFVMALMLVILGVFSCQKRGYGGMCRMKIVVVKSPKALRGILKLIFKIKDNES